MTGSVQQTGAQPDSSEPHSDMVVHTMQYEAAHEAFLRGEDTNTFLSAAGQHLYRLNEAKDCSPREREWAQSAQETGNIILRSRVMHSREQVDGVDRGPEFHPSHTPQHTGPPKVFK